MTLCSPRSLLALSLIVGSIGCDPGPPVSSGGPMPQATVVAQQAAPTPAPTKAATTESPADWNAPAIAWRTSSEGLAEAKQSGKPILAVLFTGWCPHCKNYKHVFSDPRVVEASKSFVMVHANSDDEHDFADRYAPDGAYIPRTVFLKPDGAMLAGVRANTGGKFAYFYDEHDPAPLLAAMDRAKTEVLR